MKTDNTYLSIVIPVLDEQGNLIELFEKIVSVCRVMDKPYEVIFVDDGSKDQSLSILKKISSQNRQVKVIALRKNFGQTAALAAGVDYAKGGIIVLMDADLENNPQDIPKLLGEIDKGYDVVSGWRKERWADKFLTRRLTSQTANWLISKIAGLKLHDYGCTLKAYRREIIKSISLYGEMHRFIPALAFWQGAKVKEVEVSYEPRRSGQSKYGLGRTYKVLLDLVTLKFLSGYATKPIYFFGKIGFVSMLLGFLTFIWASYYKIIGQRDYSQSPLPIFVVLFIILAVLLILIGLLAEMIMRTYHESENKKIYSVREKINF